MKITNEQNRRMLNTFSTLILLNVGINYTYNCMHGMLCSTYVADDFMADMLFAPVPFLSTIVIIIKFGFMCI